MDGEGSASHMMASLRGQRGWVTGASRGLGRAIALGLAASGVRVALTARDEERLGHVQQEIQAKGGEALLLPASVADSDQVYLSAESIASTWGRIDILVNSAGISPSMSRSEQVEPEEWHNVLDVNLSGTFFTTQAAVQHMIAGGSIINMSSVHGSVGMPRLAAYSAAKGAVEALTRTLALEWAARGIRVNALAPGYVETDMTAGLRSHEGWRSRLLEATPMGRFAKESDIVPAALFLASEASAFMTGATLTVDGGWTAH